jgi:hypothetical protein
MIWKHVLDQCRSLPVSPMRRRRLVKLQLPRISLFHPYRTEMLIAWRRPLILFRLLAYHRVVGNDGCAIAHGHNLDVVSHNFYQAGVAEIVDSFLFLEQRPVDAYQRKIVGDGPLKQRSIILLLSLDQALLASNLSVFAGAGA